MENEFDPKGKKLLAISAHADDADFSAGGTFIKWLAEGAKGAIVICTNGNKGTHKESFSPSELANLRKVEQMEASKFLGLEQTWFLDYDDAHLEVTQELKKDLVRIIREYKPDAIFTFDPTVVYSLERNFINHPDHLAVGQAALDSVFPMARDFLTFPEHHKQGLTSHHVTDIFLYNWNNTNYSVDISDVFEKKQELLCTHKSQIKKDTLENLKDWNSKNGKRVGQKYTETFVHLAIK